MSHPRIAALQNDEILVQILEYLNVLDLKRAASVNQQWHGVMKKHKFDLRLLLITLAGSNELALVSAASGHIIQRFPVAAPRRNKRKRLTRSTSSRQGDTSYCWPTCLAIGPNGQIFASQYKVQGVLEFRRSMEGFSYRRTLVSGSAFTSPEGLVVAHNSLYIVSVENATVTRVTLDKGRILEQAGAYRGMDGNGDNNDDFWTLWG